MRNPIPVICFIALCLMGACVTPKEPVNPTACNIPNLSQVEPGVWRGGQPTSAAGWTYLRGLGLTNDIKLNTGEEASDQAAVDAGFRVFYFPIDTMQQLVTGPDPAQMQEVATRLWLQGTYVHCEHGQDRTGLAVGLHRLEQGMTPASAWSEMTNHGYHPALLGLTRFWREQAEGQKFKP